jgi:hypothetical protein
MASERRDSVPRIHAKYREKFAAEVLDFPLKTVEPKNQKPRSQAGF